MTSSIEMPIIMTITRKTMSMSTTPMMTKSAAATLDEIQANDYVLTPGRYVGAVPVEDDGVPFEEKIAKLTQTLYGQMAESEKLDAAIRENLEGLGYGE